MAEEKKSFLLYSDLIHTVGKLPDETAGKLLKHLLLYVNDKNPETNDILVQVVFEPIKQQLKRDLQKWKGIKVEKSEAGKIGNLKRWNNDLYEDFKTKKITIKEAFKIAEDRKTSQPDRTRSHPIAKIAVNDNVNVNVNDNVIKKENKQKTACAEKEALFFNFWETYDKSRNKEKVKTKFFKLKNQEIEKIFETLPDYVKSTPDKKFRKDPLTYLNQKTFEDEIITNTGQTGNQSKGVQARLRENIENSKLRGTEPVDWSLL